MSNANEVIMRRKTFTPEFKQECVNLVLQHKYPVIQAAKTMNIGLSTFQRWLRQYRGEIRGNTPIASAITPHRNNGGYKNLKSRYGSC
ncbi:transposase [Yersinia aleksiciae]|uniref:transposase n=1 Tax=Yersinia aleksiciae TaxID=263819 RepID=UPI0011A948EE